MHLPPLDMRVQGEWEEKVVQVTSSLSYVLGLHRRDLYLINKAIIFATGVARFMVTEMWCMHTPPMPATSFQDFVGTYT